jgi:GntR family transcriptional repressor for pyruvate dehydrogenase complex
MTGASSAKCGPLERPLPAHGKADAVRERLITAIAVGQYLPGAKLPPERELALALGVSRATLREAMGQLEENGVLVKRLGRAGGSFVAETEASPEQFRAVAARVLASSWQDLVHASDAMCRLQDTIVRAAAENRTEGHVHLLNERLEEFRAAPSGRAKQAADAALHLAIADAAGNPVLADILFRAEQQLALSAPVHLWGDLQDQSDMEERALADHEQLVALIAARNADAAGHLARRHAGIDLDLLERFRSRASQKDGAKRGDQVIEQQS